MPVTAQFPKNPPQANATLKDAIEYSVKNPNGLTYVVNALKFLVGLVGAFLKPPIK
jgi:hypothetical protein